MNHTISLKELQVLSDLDRKGEEKPWAKNKGFNAILSDHYWAIDEKKAVRLSECATWLAFTQSEQRRKLTRANFCRVRLCPMCNWRRSMKIYSQLMRVMDALKGKGYRYLFLTLTVKNVDGDKLSSTIDDMMYGIDKFMKYKDVKTTVEGWFRSMEVTHNLKEGSKDFDTYHPHFHFLLAVKCSYFQPENYLNHGDWRQLWRKAMRLDYDPIVNIKRTYNDSAAAVAEAAKYAVKPGDYIIEYDYDLSIKTISILDQALHKRRFVGMGGVIKDMHKKLNLDDPEDGDLIHVDGEKEDDDPGNEIIYFWDVGYKQYLG